MLDSTLNSRQGFTCTTTTKLNLYKWRTTSRVCCWVFSRRGAYIGAEGVSTDLARSVWSKWTVGRPSMWPPDHSSRPPPPSSLGSFLVNRHRDVSTMSWAEPTQTLAGRLTLRPTWPRVWSTWSTCQRHPRGDAHFDIWSTSLLLLAKTHRRASTSNTRVERPRASIRRPCSSHVT
jgi:hypothetical protein